MIANPPDTSHATAVGAMRSVLRMALLTGLPPAPLYAAGALNAADRPNLIDINIDDLGDADVGPFGSKLNRTPNLERMAQEGRKLTAFYAAAACSPSHAALMTGCYAALAAAMKEDLGLDGPAPGSRKFSREPDTPHPYYLVAGIAVRSPWR